MFLDGIYNVSHAALGELKSTVIKYSKKFPNSAATIKNRHKVIRYDTERKEGTIGGQKVALVTKSLLSAQGVVSCAFLGYATAYVRNFNDPCDCFVFYPRVSIGYTGLQKRIAPRYNVRKLPT